MFVTTRSDGLVRHRAQGPVTVQAISIAYLGWARHPDFDPFLPVLWDLRGHPLEIALDELVRIPRVTNQITGRLRGGLRTGILVDNAVAEFAADLLARNPAWAADIRVFRQEGDALSWLGAGAGR